MTEDEKKRIRKILDESSTKTPISCTKNPPREGIYLVGYRGEEGRYALWFHGGHWRHGWHEIEEKRNAGSPFSEDNRKEFWWYPQIYEPQLMD